LNRTDTVQLPSFGSDCGQLLEVRKSAPAVPDTKMLTSCSAPDPELRTVIDCAALCASRTVLGKLRLEGVTVKEPTPCANDGAPHAASTPNPNARHNSPRIIIATLDQV
jgi:hypothetical protein